MTANETQAGQRSQSAFHTGRRTREASTIPTISASAACRLGIAAYGFPASWTTPFVWWSMNPMLGNMRGGAVGSTTYPIRPARLAPMIALRKRENASCRRRYTQRSARPTTVNSEFQYVHATNLLRTPEDTA